MYVGMVTMGTRKLIIIIIIIIIKRHTALKSWIATKIRWYRNVLSRGSAVQRMALLLISAMSLWASSDKGPRVSTATGNKKLIRRWDSERELSLRRHCTCTKNTIDSWINSATERFLQRRFTKFSEITQCNGHYVVQGHSRSPILVPIESSYTTSY